MQLTVERLMERLRAQPLTPGGFGTDLGWSATYRQVLTAQTILDIVDKVPDYTAQQKDAVKVQITARGFKRRIVGQRTIRVSIYDDATKFIAPLFLHDTGCDEIEVSARLIGKGVAKTVVKKVIPFKCGE